MKFIRFGAPGREIPGVLDANGDVRDISRITRDIAGDFLHPDALARMAQLDLSLLPKVTQPGRIGPCIGGVGNIIAVGLNYSDHAAEANMAVPSEPILFSKTTSSISGPDDDIPYPVGATQLDWEVELGIVIGKRASNIAESESVAHIAGYCTVNDVSERDWQLQRVGQWLKGKSAANFCPIGPWLVTPDEVPDPQNLEMFLEVNGHRYQSGTTRTMVYGVTFLVSYISRFMILEAGDVIITGTPPGVGMGQKPPVYLKRGDRMRLGVAGLGEQNQKIVD